MHTHTHAHPPTHPPTNPPIRPRTHKHVQELKHSPGLPLSLSTSLPLYLSPSLSLSLSTSLPLYLSPSLPLSLSASLPLWVWSPYCVEWYFVKAGVSGVRVRTLSRQKSVVSGVALYECIEHTRSPAASGPLPPGTVADLTVPVGVMSNAPCWSK